MPIKEVFKELKARLDIGIVRKRSYSGKLFFTKENSCWCLCVSRVSGLPVTYDSSLL